MADSGTWRGSNIESVDPRYLFFIESHRLTHNFSASNHRSVNITTAKRSDINFWCPIPNATTCILMSEIDVSKCFIEFPLVDTIMFNQVSWFPQD